ncbi:MAG: hypothetical protein R3C01_12845 [Planctomycetaceae bacterium]
MARSSCHLLKGGHRYRVVLGGAAHVNSGEGFAIYLNGRLFEASSTSGVAIRQGGQPRGAHIYADIREDFHGGKATLAATSFPEILPSPNHALSTTRTSHTAD